MLNTAVILSSCYLRCISMAIFVLFCNVITIVLVSYFLLQFFSFSYNISCPKENLKVTLLKC